MMGVLTPAQVEEYRKLRGYDGAAGAMPQPHGHP
jgi:hypothetical protein